MSTELDNEILDRIYEELRFVTVPCPECEDIDDDQYTFMTCDYTQGGDGVINVVEWLKARNRIKLDKGDK